MLCHLSHASYLLAPIPRGPHLGISLAWTVPPDLILDPDLVHCSAQFCQSWEGGREMEFGCQCRQKATLCCLSSQTRRARHWAEGHSDRNLFSPKTHPLLAPPPPRWLTLAGDKLGEPQGRGAVPSLLGTLLRGLLWRACGVGRSGNQGKHRLRSGKRNKGMISKSGTRQTVKRRLSGALGFNSDIVHFACRRQSL